VNEARGAKDTLGILFWGVMHNRYGVITSRDICFDLKYLSSNVEQFKPFNALRHIILLRPYLGVLHDGSGEDCGMWPTCDPYSKFCFGYNEVFGKIDDTTRERRYYKWVAQNYEFSKHQTFTSTTLNDHYPYNTNDPIPTPQGHQEHGENNLQPIRPRLCNYSFEEWLKIRIGHNNLHESDHEFIFNEWILDSYDVKEEYAREIGNPYSTRFDENKRVFNNEIEHLSNEYILRIGKKGYVLDDVWEKCQQNYKKTIEAWHNEGYEEDEMWRSGDEKTNYDPPYVNVKTFKVKKYSFKGGRSFICITNREDKALPLGHVNGARFKAMTRKELEGNKYAYEVT
ncbi:hypothetical protein Tco_0484420, partial [Tanacetum coccineum]